MNHLHPVTIISSSLSWQFIAFCSRETFNALANWLSDARTLASPNIVIILVGNKRDLDAEREVTFLEASRFAQENGESQHGAYVCQHHLICQFSFPGSTDVALEHAFVSFFFFKFLPIRL